jgi:hypothetical protein
LCVVNLLHFISSLALIFPFPFTYPHAHDDRQNTYTVNADGSLTLHISQMPPNPAVFAPGPAVLYVVVNGVPSIGKAIMVGGGFIGQQKVQKAAVLHPNQG